jgi:hypothetical protein
VARQSEPLNFFYFVFRFFIVRSYLVVDKIQNTKLVEFPVLYFVFLSRDKTGPIDKIVSKFCLDFVFCLSTKKRDKIENTDFKPNLTSVDHYDRERQNTKYKTGNSSSFVFGTSSTTRNDLNKRIFLFRLKNFS